MAGMTPSHPTGKPLDICIRAIEPRKSQGDPLLSTQYSVFTCFTSIPFIMFAALGDKHDQEGRQTRVAPSFSA